jgi:tetratricopeptide (TPR) repeat protein
VVPHQFLYEKRRSLPSSFNADHKRFYTPGLLLGEFEASLRPNTYRVRHLRDNDDNYTYEIGPGIHSGGGYEIELVVQKIIPPRWDLAGPPDPFQDDLERGWDSVSRLTAERDALARDSARWFDAAILAKAEQISRPPKLGPMRRLRSLSRLFRAERASTAAAIADSALKAGEWERAARFYLDALGSDPLVAKVWLRLGDSLKAAGKNPEAEFAYGRAAALQQTPTQLKL